MANFTKCDLHIPYKDWAGDQKELNNYAEIERWARAIVHGDCAGGGGCTCWFAHGTWGNLEQVLTGEWTVFDISPTSGLAGGVTDVVGSFSALSTGQLISLFVTAVWECNTTGTRYQVLYDDYSDPMLTRVPGIAAITFNIGGSPTTQPFQHVPLASCGFPKGGTMGIGVAQDSGVTLDVNFIVRYISHCGCVASS